MSAYRNLKVENEEGLALLTINRPDALNSLNEETLRELENVFEELSNDEEVEGVIVTGAGPKAFVAGADINELSQMSPFEARAASQRGQRLFDKIEAFKKPVVAAVNGFCLGGGCELALACHLRVASENARFGQPEVKLGLIPGYGGSQRLTRTVGRGRSLEIILTGEMVSAPEAAQMGLVNRVVAPDKLLEESRKLANTILNAGPLAVRYAMQAINSGAEMPLREAQALESALFGLCFATEDMREGTRAFLEKRTPRFRGE